QYLAGVGRHGVGVPQVRAGRPVAARAGPPDGLTDRPVGRAPADHQHLGLVGGVVDLEFGDIDQRDAQGPGAGHQVVVVGGVGDVAGAVGLLQPADAVLEAGLARHRPGAGQGLGVSGVRQVVVVVL